MNTACGEDLDAVLYLWKLSLLLDVTADEVGEGGRGPGLAGERKAAARPEAVMVHEGCDGEELPESRGHGSGDLSDHSQEGDRDVHDPHRSLENPCGDVDRLDVADILRPAELERAISRGGRGQAINRDPGDILCGDVGDRGRPLPRERGDPPLLDHPENREKVFHESGGAEDRGGEARRPQGLFNTPLDDKLTRGCRVVHPEGGDVEGVLHSSPPGRLPQLAMPPIVNLLRAVRDSPAPRVERGGRCDEGACSVTGARERGGIPEITQGDLGPPVPQEGGARLTAAQGADGEAAVAQNLHSGAPDAPGGADDEDCSRGECRHIMLSALMAYLSR